MSILLKRPEFARWSGMALHLVAWLAPVVYLTTPDANIDLGFFHRKNDTITVPILYGSLLNALLFYGNACWLMPRYMKNRRRYLLLAFILILAVSALETAIDTGYGLHHPAVLADIQAEFESKVEVAWNTSIAAILLMVQMSALNLFFHVVFWGLSVAYRLFRDWSRHARVQEELVREKMQAELNYLRAQINPHFLFNGINSIYHLIDKDPDNAKNILLQFSGLLRYQLYECGGDSIDLDKEVGYLENYISIEKVRKGDDAQVGYFFSIGAGSRKIAPLLLLPFIENAFKYLSNHTESRQNRVSIDLSVEDDLLELNVSNTCQPELHDPNKAGGLGLANARKRLDLLYPGRHRLQITDEKNVYQVKLQIRLEHA